MRCDEDWRCRRHGVSQSVVGQRLVDGRQRNELDGGGEVALRQERVDRRAGAVVLAAPDDDDRQTARSPTGRMNARQRQQLAVVACRTNHQRFTIGLRQRKQETLALAIAWREMIRSQAARRAARRPQCAVKWDRNLKPTLAIMRQCTSVTDRRTLTS